MKKIFLFFACIVLSFTSIAQNNIFGVNQLTGAANAVIPIFNFTRGTVNFPISLVYNYAGIRPVDVEGNAGMNWNLVAGGEITRQIKGLPDDCKKDNAGNARLGWLYNTNGVKINNFSVANTTAGNCSNETTDLNYINANFADLSDSEPDIYTVNAPGLSCQLIFDANHNVHTLAYQDISVKVDYNTITTDNKFGLIIGFTITNDKGIIYAFSLPEYWTQSTTSDTPAIGIGSPDYFYNKFNQYKNGISYNAIWHLTSITDPNGNGVMLNYKPIEMSHDYRIEDDIILYQGAAGSSTIKKNQFAVIQTTITTQILQSIQASDHGSLNTLATIDYGMGTSPNKYQVTSVSALGKSYTLEYKDVYSLENRIYGWRYLSGLKAEGCDAPMNYKFDYLGLSAPDQFNKIYIAMGDSASYHTDYWGYYSANGFTSPVASVIVNPSNPNYPRYAINAGATAGVNYTYSLAANDKVVDPTNITIGALSKISYLKGGYTTISYESNDYLDLPSNTNIQGGGVRVKQVIENYGISTANDIITNYVYNVNGKSSGKPISLPVFAFTIPYVGSETGMAMWNYSTMRSSTDLSAEDHTVLYGTVKTSRPGAGSTISQYYLPATNWDIAAAPGCSGCAADWSPTTAYTARPSCASYGAVKNDFASYPFAPNPNYDAERGLLTKESLYNESGQLVKETSYTYQRTLTPGNIFGFRYEKNNGITAYSKYKVLYENGELESQETEKVFDSPTLTKAVTTTTNNTYSSSYHNLVKQVTTNSDNSVTTVNTSYLKDYVINATGSDSTVNALYHLQKQNMNIPIENYVQTTSGGITKTTRAQLSTFKTVRFPDNSYGYLPYTIWKLVNPDGGSFNPFTINAGAASVDPQYYAAANYTAYDNSGMPQTSDDNNKNVKSVLTDHRSLMPAAVFKNAAISEVGFNDFDGTFPAGASIVLSSQSQIVNGEGHAGNSCSIGPSGTLSKIMSKKAGSTSYVFSAWIKSSGSGTLTINLTGNGTTVPVSKAFTSTSGIFKYFEWQVPVTSMPSSFTLNVSTVANIEIDDVSFYPSDAEINTYSYDPATFYRTAETNTNGISAYYTIDKWGRLLFRYDQDKNIIEKKSYLNNDDIAAGLIQPSLSVSASPAVNSPVSFNTYNYPCITGVIYTWIFGDGTSITALNGVSQLHTYSSAGTYTVSVKASHPIYGTSPIRTETIQIQYPPLQPNLCQSGVTDWDNCFHRSLNQTTCNGSPNDATHSYYTIVSVSGSGYGTLHYQWQLSTDNGNTWTSTGTDANQFVKNCAPKNQAYRVRCIVTSTVGQTGTSNYALFDVSDCR